MKKPDYWQGITQMEWKESVALEYCISQGYATQKQIDRYTEIQNKKVYKPKTIK